MGIDIFDPSGQLSDRIGESFEQLLNEIFNNNLGDCRDDDTCTKIKFDRYLKAGLKTHISKKITLGIFIERISVDADEVSTQDGIHTIGAVSLGIRF